MDVRNEAEFTALRRILELSRGTSSFTTAVCNSPAFRETLFVELRGGGISFLHAAVVAGSLDPVAEVRAQIPSGSTDALFITGLDYLLAESSADSDRLLAVLNRSRERWRSAFPKQPLVFWLTTHTSVRLTTHAPDLRAWVSHELEFEDATVSGIRPDQPSLSRNFTWLSNLDAAAKRARLADLDQRLSLDPPEPALFQEWARAWEEKIQLMTLLGQAQQAEHAARTVLDSMNAIVPIQEFWIAEITFSLAQVLLWRLDFNQALKLLRERAIPIYSRLGDRRSLAIAKLETAKILIFRKDLDTADHILRTEVLPELTVERDPRDQALALDLRARILVARGQLDRAMQIRLDEVLPTLRRIHDDRGIAVALGGVAEILCNKGSFAEALRIRRDQLLPIFIRLGDLMSQASNYSHIADILLASGQVDEAVRTLREEEQPIHELLGTPHPLTTCRARLAFALHRRSRGDDAKEAFNIMSECHRNARSHGWPEARQFEAILLSWGVPKEWLKAP